jgi:uncharacterized membrane protein
MRRCGPAQNRASARGICRIEPNGGLGVVTLSFRAAAPLPFRNQRLASIEEKPMEITSAHITPLVALIAGILILIMPRLLNFIVAIYLIIIGIMGLNGIYHFFH